MTDATASDRLTAALHAYGADLSRWPAPEIAASARAALLADPAFRQDWDQARGLDGRLVDSRAAVDRAIAASGALARLRASTAAIVPQPFRWRQLAAAIVAAAVLGGAVDTLFLSQSQADPDATVAVDTLVYGPDQMGL